VLKLGQSRSESSRSYSTSSSKPLDEPVTVVVVSVTSEAERGATDVNDAGARAPCAPLPTAWSSLVVLATEVVVAATVVVLVLAIVVVLVVAIVAVLVVASVVVVVGSRTGAAEVNDDGGEKSKFFVK